MKTRASQRIKQVVNIEPEKIQLPAVKDKAVETLEPALTKGEFNFDKQLEVTFH